MKTKVVTSRQWHSPNIETFVSSQEVGSKIDLNDFVLAVLEQIGNPTLLITRNQLKTKVDAAVAQVLADMRDKTKHIV